MDILTIDAKTGKEATMSIPDINSGFFAFANNFELNDEQVRSFIDRMKISADAKALLYQFSKATIRAGAAIIKIGRKIIDILFSTMNAFPNITFGVIFGLVVGALVASIPLIGAVLGSLATAIAVILGVVLGANEELKSGDLGERVKVILAEFSSLRS